MSDSSEPSPKINLATGNKPFSTQHETSKETERNNKKVINKYIFDQD